MSILFKIPTPIGKIEYALKIAIWFEIRTDLGENKGPLEK